MCCSRLAGNTGRKNDAKNRYLCTITQICRAISSQLRHASTIGKNLLSSNISPTCPYNMVKFSPLAAEIVSLVCGIPENFNGFCVLAALLHGTLLVGVSQTAALNRERHLYSAGRPSRWALDHISSFGDVLHNQSLGAVLKELNLTQLECKPMPNVMVDLPNIGGALCSTPQSLADAHYYNAVQ